MSTRKTTLPQPTSAFIRFGFTPRGHVPSKGHRDFYYAISLFKPYIRFGWIPMGQVSLGVRLAVYNKPMLAGPGYLNVIPGEKPS
jgi:hypothetical protein